MEMNISFIYFFLPVNTNNSSPLPLPLSEYRLQRRVYSHSSHSQIVLGGFPRVPAGEEEAVPA